MPLVMEQCIKRLLRHSKPDRNYGPVQRKAAVAITLREIDGDIRILMIRRAVRQGDPWSGHMGFPGGRRDPEDHSNLACAKRETIEEIGLDLEENAELIVELGDVNTGWRPDRPEMLVTPYVFRLNASHDPKLVLNYEVDGVVWVPLAFLLDKGNRIPLKWEWRGEKVESDSYLYKGNRIWGLSLMMLDELIEAVER